jgi:hypothetical protein
VSKNKKVTNREITAIGEVGTESPIMRAGSLADEI